MLKSNIGYRAAAGIAGAVLIVTISVPAAFGHLQAAPKIVGNAKAGKTAFMTTCAACHTLKAAGAVGQIGPNLDKVPLPQATLIKAITLGGAAVMGKAANKYTSHMTAYKGVLTTAQIQNVSAFVYTSTHK